MAKNTMFQFVPNYSCGPCIYCDDVSEFCPEDLLQCDSCKRSVHIKCLKTGIPEGRLLGDNFFKFTCVDCNETGKEVVIRVKLSTVHTLLLAMYNLHLTEERSSKNGHFHYKDHVHNFIKSKWKELFSHDKEASYKNLKLYPNIISGQLSQCSYFTSMKEGPGKVRRGWYKLVSVVPPTRIIHNFALDFNRSAKRKVSELDMNIVDPSAKMMKKDNSLEFLGRSSQTMMNIPVLKEDHTEESSLDSFDDSSKGSWFLDSKDIYSERVPVNIFDSDEEPNSESEKTCSSSDSHPKSSPYGLYKPQKQQSQHSSTSTRIPLSEAPSREGVGSAKETTPITVFKFSSLFHRTKEPDKRNERYSDENEIKEDDECDELVPMSIYEERNILKKLNAREKLPRDLYYLRRKLIVRETKRKHNLSVFNIDQECKFLKEHCRLMTEKERLLYNDSPAYYPGEGRVLDRYQVPEATFLPKNLGGMSFRMRLTGSEGLSQPIFSPYSKRTLKPVIWQDFESKPMKLKLLAEIVERRKEKLKDPTPIIRKPINYYYVSTKHIPAMNHLAREFFWPGIELSEVLQYPDFTCVAMYGHLTIGFGVLVPDISPQEGYISFMLVHPEWRNAGVGKFMLYHLIQTSPGKDITLHVSCTNPALIMYQNFGFKVEEFLENFYDKYLAEDSPECKHAFFLRLNR